MDHPHSKLCREKEPSMFNTQPNRLELTAVNDGGLLGVVDGAGSGASGLESLDNPHGLVIGNLAEDDVTAIEPRGLDGSDEELGAVAVATVS